MSTKRTKTEISPAVRDSERRELVQPPNNRRRHERYETTKSLVVIPVLADGTPDMDRRHAGFSVNVSEGGIGIEVDDSMGEMPTSLLIGVEGEDGRTRFAGVRVCRSQPGMSSGIYVGAVFGGPGENILQDGILRPRFNAETLKLEHALPQPLLDQYVNAGVLTRDHCDQVLVCPQCRCLPTFRSGCRNCGSALVEQDQLIHHFACAHVDLAKSFGESGIMTCPKCRTSSMVVGADFEYLNGQHQCLNCHWKDTMLESIGHCLKCNHRFCADEAAVEPVFVYSSNRLNWRQMIDEGRAQE